MSKDYTDEERRRIRSMRDAWSMTKQRCHNPKCRDYKHYGGRGIRLCERWHTFENFLEDMGIRPDGMTLERKDNDKDYSPGNCVWATRAEQAANTRCVVKVEWQGKTMTISEWERELGWKPGALKARLRRLSYTVEEAFTKPVKCGAKLETRAYPPRKPVNPEKLKRGVDHPMTLLAPASIAYCREMHRRGASFSKLARDYGVSIKTIANACKGEGAYLGV